MAVGRCSECDSDDLWAWYTQPERQTIDVHVHDDGKVTYDYSGVTKSGYDAGDDTEYYCGNCMAIFSTVEEMVGAPPAPPVTGVRLKIEAGIPGNDQESSFTNATLQTIREDLEFSIATYISVGESVKTEADLASLISNVLAPIVAEDPRISFEVQLGPYGEGPDEEIDESGDESDTDDDGGARPVTQEEYEQALETIASEADMAGHDLPDGAADALEGEINAAHAAIEAYQRQGGQ